MKIVSEYFCLMAVPQGESMWPLPVRWGVDAWGRGGLVIPLTVVVKSDLVTPSCCSDFDFKNMATFR